jgi:hypothetical protein
MPRNFITPVISLLERYVVEDSVTSLQSVSQDSSLFISGGYAHRQMQYLYCPASLSAKIRIKLNVVMLAYDNDTVVFELLLAVNDRR